jgi:hypothetical protein
VGLGHVAGQAGRHVLGRLPELLRADAHPLQAVPLVDVHAVWVLRRLRFADAILQQQLDGPQVALARLLLEGLGHVLDVLLADGVEQGLAQGGDLAREGVAGARLGWLS